MKTPERIDTGNLSRAARRALAKVEKMKGPKHGPKSPKTMELAVSRAAKLTYEDQCNIMGIINHCFDLMRKGEWRAPEWNTLADMLNLAAALASPGFNLLNDHIGKFHAGMDVLAAVAERMKAGKGWTCYAEELKTMELAIEFFCYQIQFASRGEYFRAIEYARSRVSGAGSGTAKVIGVGA